MDTSTEAVKALLDGVTPGPWSVYGTRHRGDLKLGKDARLHFVGPDCDHVAGVFYDMNNGLGWKDAKFIAAARELVPALLAERDAAVARAEAAEAEVQRLREALAEIRQLAKDHAHHSAVLSSAIREEITRLDRAALRTEGEGR